MGAPLSAINTQNDEWYLTRGYQPFTVTIAAPGVFTRDNHGLSTNDRIRLFTSGTIPTGLTASTGAITDPYYYVIYVTDHTFQLSATRDGTAITTTGTQSGTHHFAAEKQPRMTVGYENNR